MGTNEDNTIVTYSKNAMIFKERKKRRIYRAPFVQISRRLSSPLPSRPWGPRPDGGLAELYQHRFLSKVARRQFRRLDKERGFYEISSSVFARNSCPVSPPRPGRPPVRASAQLADQRRP